MASTSSRLFNLIGTCILRHPCNPSPYPSLRFHKLIFPARSHSLRFARCSSSAVTVEPDASVSTYCNELRSDSHHPWPEWVSFVDRLKEKGYLVQGSVAAPPLESGGGGSDVDGLSYTEMGLLKDACLSFARDRFDIFNSLSRQDIQTVVEKACPNLFRKAVNSAKRLRAYLEIDESNACSACNLRGSCDRAYVLLNESEAGARTVDIVRIVLLYALDPLVTSGGNRPAGRDLIEASVRKLLSNLIELSETPIDPELPKPAVRAPAKKKSLDQTTHERSKDIETKTGDWTCTECNFMNFARNTRCLKCKAEGPNGISHHAIEMKKGDWCCPQCNFLNFSRNVRCLKCKAEGPERISPEDVEMKKGDWNCPQCNFMNFAKNVRCLKCKAEGPERISPYVVEMKKGDWTCPECNFMNYARNVQCLRCKAKGPQSISTSIGMKQGDWSCPSCNFLNFSRNIVCKRCDHEKPEESKTQYEEQLWNKPF